MTDLAIKVEGLGKRYTIGERRRYKSLRESLSNLLRSPSRILGGTARSSAGEPIWVLQDVSFSIRRGEAVGVIGRNGAGKSTLLRILSRITWPTVGRAELRGRVGSLLELGTGFHPELTGRENIYLSSAIIGMKRREIAPRFDQIVAFAEIDRFLDTPVKFYSTGMYMRLAFSVAAHLEPEILLVDEVLAVGDSNFQKKCLGKMGEVAQEGRTVLFVSHSLGLVNQLCERALWFDQGRLVIDGPPAEVVSRYVAAGQEVAGRREWTDGVASPGVSLFKLRSVLIRNLHGDVTSSVETSMSFAVEIAFVLMSPVTQPCRVGFSIRSAYGVVAFEAYDSDEEACRNPRDAGLHVSICLVPGHLLNDGRYFLSVNADLPNVLQLVFLEDALVVDVVDTQGEFAEAPRRQGMFRPVLRWSTARVQPEDRAL